MRERVFVWSWLIVFAVCVVIGGAAHYCTIKMVLGYGTVFCTPKIETSRK